MASALLFAYIFGLNKVLVLVASNISVPPVIPVIVYGSLKMGEWLIGTKKETVSYDKELSFEIVKEYTLQYAIGSLSLATITGCVLGVLTYVLLKFFRKDVKEMDNLN